MVHVLMPIVSGTRIGLDNTCKAVYSTKEFFAVIKDELLAYKETLEHDISLLEADVPLRQQKQERLIQINIYLEAVTHLEYNKELECLNQDFPSYPRPLEELMQDRTTSNLYSMVLRPTNEDGFLRSEAANPIFSVAHRSVAKGRGTSISPLQQALIQAYTPLNFQAKNLKSHVIQQTLAQIPAVIPVDFERLRQTLQERINTLLNVSVDLTQNPQGASINQQDIDEIMAFDSQTTALEYIDVLLEYCAPNAFDNVIESPFNTLTQVEAWSIATQFLLGITNIYCVTKGIVSPDTNFGRILDSTPELSHSLAQALAQAQQGNRSIEEACLFWINGHTGELKLNISLTQEEFKNVQETFATRYAEIKNSPHFDEFFLLDASKKGDFSIHQGSICTSFAKFACSSLFQLPPQLTQHLEKVYSEASTLNTEIPHNNTSVPRETEIDTATMTSAALQALYERITTHKDITIKKDLLTQLKQERPDFKPQINVKQFLQHVAYGAQYEAEKLLESDEEIAQELLTARKIPFTDYSGRTFTCSAYEYAYWAKDSYMCRMLEKYMDENTKKELLIRVQKIEELIGDELFKTTRGLTYTQKGIEHRSAHFDLTPLKQALQAFIDAVNQKPEDMEARGALWLKVGLLQREVPAHIAQEYCYPKRSSRRVRDNPSLVGASNFSNVERQLEFHNEETDSYELWFTPDSFAYGLGSSFTITAFWFGVSSSLEGGLGMAMTDLKAIKIIDEARTEDLKQSQANLAAPSIQQSHNLHGT